MDGLTRSRWETESTVWDVQRGLLPGPARAESRADQGACVDGCRVGRRPRRLRALNRIIRYRFSLSLPISHRRLTTVFIRGPGDYIPSGRIGSDGSSSGAKARQAYHSAHFVLRYVSGAHPSASSRRARSRARSRSSSQSTRTYADATSLRSTNSCDAATTRRGYTRNSTSQCGRARYTFCARSYA